MSVIHEVHFAGAEKSIELELDTDDLYRKFVAWLEGGNARGLVVETEGHTIAINFAQVGSISMARSRRRGWGFQVEWLVRFFSKVHLRFDVNYAACRPEFVQLPSQVVPAPLIFSASGFGLLSPA